MNTKEVQLANKDRGLSRNDHDGFVVRQRRLADTTIRGILRKGFFVEFETPYSVKSSITPHTDQIKEILAGKAAEGEYEGDPPYLIGNCSYTAPRKGKYWMATAIYNKEWIENRD